MKKVNNNDDIQEKLDYINLDLSKPPKFIRNGTIPTFTTNGLNNDKESKVYKYIPINEIEILITPYLRSDDLKKKFSNAVHLNKCLNPNGNEEDKILYKYFAKTLKSVSIDEVKKMEKIQENFLKSKPFKIKYNRDHLWQIYYSEKSNKYFMLVCTKENTFTEFVYLLKKQIEFAKSKQEKAPLIYAPVNYIGYSEEILNKIEIADLENYLWLFTKNWPMLFEVYDKDNNVSLNIIGETFVYRNVKSNYKMTFDDRNEAMKFYKLLKALFIMQTEIKDQYQFETRIDDECRLVMFLAKVEITYDSLTSFIKNEIALADYEIVNKNKEIIKKEKKLFEIKASVKEKETEYFQKQKEISTYLECKKTFFGKVKYFFKSDKKMNSKNNNSNFDDISNEDEISVSTKPIKSTIEKKKYYTIEDLVVIYNIYDKCLKRFKEVNQDIDAMQLKLENLNSKVKNANIYIDEIDKHKKSIFDFWKFANKDEKLSLEEGENLIKNNGRNGISKIFNFDDDFEKLGENVDAIQRKKLSIEELDSIYIAQTEVLPLINMMCANKISKSKFKNMLENLKNEFENNKLIISDEAFDIFGNIDGNNNKVKYIGSRSHREVEKNKFRILNINKKIDIFDFTEKIQATANYLSGAFPKISSLYSMNLYKLQNTSENLLPSNGFEIFNINVQDELIKCKDLDGDAYNLIVLNYEEGLPLIYFTNSVFYDNTNKTLPLGMNLSSNVLIDNEKVKYELVNKTSFKINSFLEKNANEESVNAKTIYVYEYDMSLKSKKKNLREYFDNEMKNNDEIEDETENECDNEMLERIVEENIEELKKKSKLTENEKKSTEKITELQQPIVKKSKKLLKIEKQYEKEIEKQEKREEKARKKLNKNS